MSLQKQNPPVRAGSASAFAERAGQAQGNPVEMLLQRLEGVKRSGLSWRACCPSCGGRSDKVSITAAGSGTVLLHAFCGCTPADVLAAVGLRLSDLFPKPLRPLTDIDRREARRRAREAGWGAALDVLCKEAAVIEIAARQLARWQCLSPEDEKRLAVACERVGEARTALNGR